MLARERFEALAQKWQASGRPPSLLLDGYELIALQCWMHSRGAKAEGFSEELGALAHASLNAQPEDWLDAYLSERERCAVCGESYRFENISLCTNCRRTFCYKCGSDGPLAPNGNPACSCGGELVG